MLVESILLEGAPALNKPLKQAAESQGDFREMLSRGEAGRKGKGEGGREGEKERKKKKIRRI